nr:TBC1 domain family member 23 [Haemonchus contortus]
MISTAKALVPLVTTDCNKDMVSSSSLVSFASDPESKKLLWVRFLGVVNRPNPLDDWDQLYNLNNQAGLRNDCRKLAKLLDNKKSVPELESFMTLYCKKRNVDYKKDSGWIVVLEKILKFDLPQEHLFNVFFAFTTKYIPKETKENAQIYDLFRLLLQYHDPVISSHLDSLKCMPYSYANQWFSTVLAASVDDGVCRVLWELYIEKGDPFLIFYMALVLIINSRDELLGIGFDRRDDAHKVLSSLPNQLTIDDVPDFVQLSAYYADRTPQCVREDFHYLIFGSNYDDEVGEMQVSKLLCLPVTIQELTRKERSAVATSNITYFIIDCRSNEAYNSGHIYGSFNLDCKLLVDAPSQFEMALSCLESYKHEQKFDEHICFFGYGDEDQDQFMNMVIARFLRDGKSHVTFAQGGYRGLHSVLSESNRLRLINSHDESKCRECGNASSGKSWKLVGKMKEVVISKSAAVKDKVSELVTQAAPGSAPTNEVKHVLSSDRYGKRYRNEPSVFSIDDDSSDESGGTLFSKSTGKEELLLTEQAEFIEHFQCHELADNKMMIPSHIAITRTHMHVLRDVEGKPGYVTTEARHALSSILRVTSKKKVPELLTFKFGYEISGVSKITAVHRFLVPKAGECAKAVKTAIFALRPLSDSESAEPRLLAAWFGLFA